MRLLNKFKMLFFMLTRGEAGELWKEVKRRLYSNERSLCLRRDLDEPFETPAAKIELRIRPLQPEDVPKLLEEYDSDVPNEAVKERARRKLFLRENVPTCYVAVTEDDEPCYMQWLMSAEQNDQIQSYFNGGFPVLNSDEGLLEFAFALEKYRGLRIMPHAMAEIAKKGKEFGARYIITFVREENIPSLKGCKRAGFWPYMVRDDKWRFFTRKVEFHKLPEGTPYSFDVEDNKQHAVAQ